MRKFITLLATFCVLMLSILLFTGCDKTINGSAPTTTDSNGGNGGNDGSPDDAWREVTVSLEDGKYKVEKYYKDLLNEEYYYDADGNREYLVSYRYNDAGQLTRLSWSSNDLGIDAAGFYEYDYDENGKMIQKRVLNGIQNPTHIYDYNADGTTDLTYYHRGEFPVFTNLTAKMVGYTVTRFDANGNKLYADGHSEYRGHLTHTEYNADGSGTTWTYRWDLLPTETVEYITTFDSKGQFLKETYYNTTDGSVISINDGVFDENGTLIGRHEHPLDFNTMYYSYEMMYNLNGDLLWYKSYAPHGVLEFTEVNEFDATTGLMIKTTKTDPNGDLMEYTTYEYYDNGNYRKMMHYDADGNFTHGSEWDEEGFEHGIWPEE